jgi:wyosine [tRNA(Phe)-imidazoG37] synthetase (radical SAM superfamily)
VSPVLDFRSHGRALGQNRYVYAVVSRRAQGLSVGVNMNPDRVCNFDCPYCQVDRSGDVPSGEVDVQHLEAEIADLLRRAAGDLWNEPPFDTVLPAYRRVADIAFAGDGEPTTPREFPEAARATRTVRDEAGLAVPLRLLTNATLLDRPRVREGLALFDELWCKLDGGTAEQFRLASGSKIPFGRILANITSVARERPVVIQSLFFAFGDTPPAPGEIEAFGAALTGIAKEGGQIDRVQVYTVARLPAAPRVAPLPDEALAAIAESVRLRGFKAEVHGAAS